MDGPGRRAGGAGAAAASGHRGDRLRTGGARDHGRGSRARRPGPRLGPSGEAKPHAPPVRRQAGPAVRGQLPVPPLAERGRRAVLRNRSAAPGPVPDRLRTAGGRPRRAGGADRLRLGERRDRRPCRRPRRLVRRLPDLRRAPPLRGGDPAQAVRGDGARHSGRGLGPDRGAARRGARPPGPGRPHRAGIRGPRGRAVSGPAPMEPPPSRRARLRPRTTRPPGAEGRSVSAAGGRDVAGGAAHGGCTLWAGMKPALSFRVFASARGNVFMTEIATLVCSGLRDLGHEVQLVRTGLPEPATDTVNLVVAPHEYFHLASEYSEDERLQAASDCAVLNVEQPGTPWFEIAYRYCVPARH